MPELPEVENVRRSLSKLLPTQAKLEAIKLHRADLRFPIPKKALQKLLGSNLLKIERRGKYLLFVFSEGIVISHLGMTGQWRVTEGTPPEQKHDHVQWQLGGHTFLTYNDPRRFGYLFVVRDQAELQRHPSIEPLGVEPLSAEFTAERLLALARGSVRSIKVFLMDQKVVVGVGNIYASEVLFLARVKPTKKAGRVSRDQWQAVVQATKVILEDAIRTGGSTIRDYRNPEGFVGGFQQQHKVYDRKGQPCLVCGHTIKATVLGGRATYWCSHCQK